MAIETADISCAIGITYPIDHCAFATVASVNRKFGFWKNKTIVKSCQKLHAFIGNNEKELIREQKCEQRQGSATHGRVSGIVFYLRASLEQSKSSTSVDIGQGMANKRTYN